MRNILLTIWLSISILLIMVYFYQIVIAAAGFKRFKPAPHSKPSNKIAVIIPAHNEERVISETARSLMNNRYPVSLFDVIVVADNCSDKTAEAAEAAGALVMARYDPELNGKGHVMRWVLDRIGKYPYDAFIIVDADNVVAGNFLAKMNNELNNGHKVIQGYLGTKNPNDSWVTKTIFVTYAFTNRFFELSRENLGLCVALGGTGVCLHKDIIRKYGWNFFSLTEDLEFTVKLAMDGVRTRFAYDAVVYDEKPTTIYSALKQRQRWMHGHATVVKKYGLKLFTKGVMKGDPLSIDASMYILLPLLMMGWVAIDLARIVLFWGDPSGYPGEIMDISIRYLNLVVAVGFSLWWIVIPLYAVKMEGKNPFHYWYGSIGMALVAWIMLILFVLGLFGRNDKKWWHTKHGASLDLSIDVNR